MILIIGMGLTGLTIADQIVKYTEHEVLMIEKEAHYGGLHYEYCEKDIIRMVVGGEDKFYRKCDYTCKKRSDKDYINYDMKYDTGYIYIP